jgi:hypothetical protein
MKNRILSLGMVALALSASSAAYASAHVDVVLNPFGWGVAPPVVYEPPRYYAPPTVYYGRGHWGDRGDSRGHDRGHDDRGHDDRGHDDRHR